MRLHRNKTEALLLGSNMDDQQYLCMIEKKTLNKSIEFKYGYFC